MTGTIDVAALERELSRVPEITAARVVGDENGQITEVHILSLPTKHAKQVVRDVQSVARALFDIDLDRRVVSVVQLDGVSTSSVEVNGDADDELFDEDLMGEVRINVEAVSAHRTGLQCTAQVVLTRGAERATGTAEGLGSTSTTLRLVAHAAISALRQFEPAASKADVETASVFTMGERRVAVTTVVVVVPPYEEVIAGSALVHSAGELDAVARAVLDATNRRLPQLR